MNQQQKTLVALLSVIVVLLAGAAYYFLIEPVRQDIKTTEASIDSLQDELVELRARDAALDEEKPILDEKPLLSKLPLGLEEERLIQFVQEAELTTGTIIDSISFDSPEDPVTAESLGIEDDASEAEAVAEEEATDDEAEGEEASEDVEEEATDEAETDAMEDEGPIVSEAVNYSLPDNVHLVTMTIQARHASVAQYVSFVKTLERHPRLVKFDSTTFDPDREDELMDPPSEKSSSTQLTLFYMPKD